MPKFMFMETINNWSVRIHLDRSIKKIKIVKNKNQQ
jgi:hypothetical protein